MDAVAERARPRARNELRIRDYVEYIPNNFNPKVKRYTGRVTDIVGDCVWIETQTTWNTTKTVTAHRQWLRVLSTGEETPIFTR